MTENSRRRVCSETGKCREELAGGRFAAGWVLERVVARLPPLRESPALCPHCPLEWWWGAPCGLESRTWSWQGCK